MLNTLNYTQIIAKINNMPLFLFIKFFEMTFVIIELMLDISIFEFMLANALKLERR